MEQDLRLLDGAAQRSGAGGDGSCDGLERAFERLSIRRRTEADTDGLWRLAAYDRELAAR